MKGNNVRATRLQSHELTVSVISRNELDLDLRAVLFDIQLKCESIAKEVGAGKQRLRILGVSGRDKDGGFVFPESVELYGQISRAIPTGGVKKQDEQKIYGGERGAFGVSC